MVFQLGATENVGAIPSSGYSSGVGSALGDLLQGGINAVGGALQGGVKYASEQPAAAPVGASSSPSPTTLQQLLLGQMGRPPAPQLPSAMPNPQFNQINPVAPVQDNRPLLFNGKQYSPTDLLAYGGPKPLNVGGTGPAGPWGQTATDATNATRGDNQQGGQTQPATPLEEGQRAVAQAVGSGPAFSPASSQPLVGQSALQGVQQFTPDGGGANGAPLDYSPPPPGYPLGQWQQLPPRRDMLKDLTPQEISLMTPELAGQVERLKKMQDHYQAFLNNGDPYDTAVKYFSEHTPSRAQRFLQGMATGLNHGRPISTGVPQTLDEYLKSPSYQNQRALYDDAQDKYYAATTALENLFKEQAAKKFELAKEMAAAKVVPFHVKQSIMKEFAAEPPMIPGPDDKPIQNYQKLQAIDMYINAGLLSPDERAPIFNTYAITAKTEQDHKNIKFAQDVASEQLKQKTDELKYQKLKGSLELDLNIKQAHLGVEIADRALKEAKLKNLPIEQQERIDKAKREMMRFALKEQTEKRVADHALAQDRISWAKIASSNASTTGKDGKPIQNAMAPYTMEAVAEAKRNVQAIDAYLAGKYNDYAAGFEAVTGRVPGANELITLINSKDPAVKDLQARVVAKSHDIRNGKSAQAAPQNVPAIAAGDTENEDGEE